MLPLKDFQKQKNNVLMVWNPSACSKTHRSMNPGGTPDICLTAVYASSCYSICVYCGKKPLPHLEYNSKRFVARAADFPIAYDQNKRLAASAVEFPLVLANLEAKPDALYDRFERLTIANERLTKVLSKFVNLETTASADLAKDHKQLGEYTV